MKKHFILAALLALSTLSENLFGQLPDASTRIYTLLSGSQLTDDCPICARIPIVVPMSGTFRLRLLEPNPLFNRYAIEDIAFHAGTNGAPEYWVSGSGIYEIGGEVAVIQHMSLNLAINDGITNRNALCVNADPVVTRAWPELEVTVDQTNGTLTKVYYLKIVAAPALQFRAITPDLPSGNILLEWDSSGSRAQLERSHAVEGPYSPISPITTDQTFSDIGALTNRALFYRLRQY